MARWLVAVVVAAGVFGVVAWVAGAFVLPLVMSSGGDRWVVAAGVGAAAGAAAALWGQSWAGREDERPGTAGESGASGAGGLGERSISAGGSITGIASTGDHARNEQRQ